MPVYTRGVKRDQIVYVPVNAVILYGFSAKNIGSIQGVSAADVTALGHLTPTAADAVSGGILILGANAPKPARVVKKITGAAITAQASVSTFCSYTKIADAQTAGWRLAKGRTSVSLQAGSTFKRSLSAIATLSNGALYVFPMNAADFATHGQALGLAAAASITTETERNKLIRGTTIPRPGKAVLDVTSDTSTGTFSSFCSSDAALTGGYSRVSDEVII